jgi:phosphoribosylanthranilate isomerase
MTHVKLCGFQRSEDALAAAEAGADALGLVFVPSARRRLSVNRAQVLIREFRAAWGDRPSPEWVGLFADQPAQEVQRTVGRLGLDAVQLCGEEGMGYCAEMMVPIYKVISIDPTVPQSVVLPRLMVLLQRHSMAGHRPVLDTQIPGAYGGTGQTFDWELAAGLSESFPFSLAGGLTPQNVGGAIARVHPWGVDTSSGVETEGKKDPALIRAFVEAAHQSSPATKRRGLRGLFSRSSR